MLNGTREKLAAEGNVPGTNISGLVKRRIDVHIRAYIRIPDGYRYMKISPASDE